MTGKSCCQMHTFAFIQLKGSVETAHLPMALVAAQSQPGASEAKRTSAIAQSSHSSSGTLMKD